MSALLVMTAGCVLPSLTADRDDAAQGDPGGQGGAGGAGGVGGAGGAGGVGGAGGAGGVGGADEPMAIAEAQVKPNAIAVSSGVVYWTNESGNGVRRATTSGVSLEEIPGMLVEPCGIAVIGQLVYVRSRGSTGAVTLFNLEAEGSYTTTATTSPKCRIAVGAEALYWMDGSSVMRAPLGSTVGAAITTGVNPAWVNVSASGDLYWTDFAPATGGGAVHVFTKASNMDSVVAPMQASPWAVAASSGTVFWTNLDTPGTVMASSQGGAVQIATDQAGPYALAIDEERVYWVNVEGGQVMSVPRGGGPATVVADKQKNPCSIALDTANVYWTTCEGGTVMRAKKLPL